MKRLLFAALLFILLACGGALHAQVEVRGLPNTPKSDKEGFSVVLTDSGPGVLLVSGLATVPDTFGAIESVQLLVMDQTGKRLSRAVLAGKRLDGQPSQVFEFDLHPSLLEKSVIVIRSRVGADFQVARIILGSFHVGSSKK